MEKSEDRLTGHRYLNVQAFEDEAKITTGMTTFEVLTHNAALPEMNI